MKVSDDIQQTPVSTEINRVRRGNVSTYETVLRRGCKTDESMMSSSTDPIDDHDDLSIYSVDDMGIDNKLFVTPVTTFEVMEDECSIMEPTQRKRFKRNTFLDNFQLPDGVIDIDAEDRDDATKCTEFNQERMNWLRSQERLLKYHVNSDEILEIQNPLIIGISHRTLLVDWLAFRVNELQLLTETLHCSVNLLDRGLSEIQITDSVDGEVLAGACLHAAIKLEETNTVPLKMLREGLHNHAIAKRIITMEATLVEALDFALQAPLITSFLPRYLQVFGESLSSRTGQIAVYLADLSLASIKSAKYLPSQLAAGCVSVALAIMNQEFYSRTFQHETGGIELKFLGKIMRFISSLHRIGCEHYPLRGIYNRHYSAETNYAASIMALTKSKVDILVGPDEL